MEKTAGSPFPAHPVGSQGGSSAPGVFLPALSLGCAQVKVMNLSMGTPPVLGQERPVLLWPGTPAGPGQQ